MKINTKRITWAVVLLLLIAGAIVCKVRWDTWFYNAPEIKFKLASHPQGVLLTFGNEGELSRNVSWVNGGTSRKGGLQYTKVGTTDTLFVHASTRFVPTLGGYAFMNWARFGQLSFGDTYTYRVWSGEEPSAWYRFEMQQGVANDFSLAFIGDVQDTLNGKSRVFMENVRRQLPQAEFYMFVGDFAERPMNCYWEYAYHSIDSIAPHKPVMISPGNHEYFKGFKAILGKRFAYTFSYLLNSRYLDNNVFSIDYKDATIITLDSNRDPWFLLAQRDWLEKALKASTKKWKIVMLHHPVYSIKGRNNNLFVRLAFNSLFQEHGVDLVLQGHEHNYARMTTKEEDGTMTTPVYLVSHASPKAYRLSFNKLYDRFGTNHRFYQSVYVHGDTLRIKAFLEDNSLYDDVSIVKNDDGTQIIDAATNIPEILEMPWLTGKKAKEFAEKATEWRVRER